MTTFNLKELREDTLYRCVLSNRIVLVTSIQERQSQVMGKLYTYTEVDAWVYNPITGNYDLTKISNNQLTTVQ